MIQKKVMVFIFIFSISFLAQNIFLDNLWAADCSDQTFVKANEAFCRNELDKLEAQEKALIKELEKQSKQSNNYASEVKRLTTEINALKTKVKARTLIITQLRNDINNKNSRIKSLSEKIESEYQSLSQLLRNTNEFDNANILHLILSDSTISDFYGELESYSSIKKAIKKSVDEVKGIKTDTEKEKTELEKKQNAEIDAKYELESAQKRTAQVEAEQKKLLAVSKDKEAVYQKQAAEKKAKADQIRNALFRLAGIAESQAIDFGTALQYATEAKNKFGIEPAFLLAVLKQESNLGANVGQCYLTDPATGSGVGKNTGTVFKNVMKPMGLPGRKGDVDDFMRITKALGLVWNKTAISCPIAGIAGYGGAMGPAQFIPSTWSGYEKRLKAFLGHEPNPWAPRDAFMASAMFLTDLGAIGNSASVQHKAACRYYGTGGASCSYSKSVLSLKMKIQADIDLLSN